MEETEIALDFWKKLSEALEDENGLRCLRRVYNNASTLSAMMEAHGMLTEANSMVYTLQAMNKKISMATHNRAIDNVLVFVFLKQLLTIPTQTKAFKLGLIDKEGRLIRKPATKEEEDCISNLDLLMFHIRKWLAPKLQYLTSVSWLKGAGNNVRLQNYFSNAETATRQYMVTRVIRDLDKLLTKG